LVSNKPTRFVFFPGENMFFANPVFQAAVITSTSVIPFGAC